MILGMIPDLEVFEEAMGRQLDRFAHDCHRASLAIVKSDLYETARVVRGFAPDITYSQHSWVILGEDPYDMTATILDPTAWSYEGVDPYIWYGTYFDKVHEPHGMGYRHDFSSLDQHRALDREDIISLDEGLLSEEATRFYIENLYDLSSRGWHDLFHGKMQGWPSSDILEAANSHPRLAALIPIDLLGMLTEINPMGLYR